MRLFYSKEDKLTADKKRLKMGASADVKRTLNRVSNMVLNGEMESKDADVVMYTCSVTLGVIRVDEQKRRLSELEQFVSEKVQHE